MQHPTALEHSMSQPLPPPPGVPAQIWAAMTPAEQAQLYADRADQAAVVQAIQRVSRSTRNTLVVFVVILLVVLAVQLLGQMG